MNVDEFRRFTTTLQNRGQELAQARLPDLHAVFSSRRKKDQDMEFCCFFGNAMLADYTSNDMCTSH